MSNKTIFIDEGTISDPMVAWIHVKAVNVSSNKQAAVNLTIIKGKSFVKIQTLGDIYFGNQIPLYVNRM